MSWDYQVRKESFYFSMFLEDALSEAVDRWAGLIQIEGHDKLVS